MEKSDQIFSTFSLNRIKFETVSFGCTVSFIRTAIEGGNGKENWVYCVKTNLHWTETF